MAISEKISREFTEDEKVMLNEFVKRCGSKAEAARQLGLTWNGFKGNLLAGSCHPRTYKTYSRKVFNAKSAA